MVQIPRFPFCCFVVPLRIGAFIIAAWLLFWNGFTGVEVMFTSYGSGTFANLIWKVLGVLYLLVAAASLIGVRAIYYESASGVRLFYKIYIAATVFYFMANIAFIIIVSMVVSSAEHQAKTACENANQETSQADAQAGVPTTVQDNCDAYSVGYPIFGWLIEFIIGLVFQTYFVLCVRSYSLELQESENEKPPQVGSTNDFVRN